MVIIGGKMLSIIVAKSNNNIIGKENHLIWSLPEDLKNFKNLTINHTIIMGRKTFESIGKVLQNRTHIIFSQNLKFKVEEKNVKIVHSLFQIKDLIDSDEEIFVIGGSMIYNLLMPYTKKMYVTEINKDFYGDVSFPIIDLNVWKEISRKKGKKDKKNNLDYEFVIYERK